MVFALGKATGSYAFTMASSVSSWFIIGMTRASHTSSMSGLNAKPKIAMFLPLMVPNCCLHLSKALSGWVWFTFSTGSKSSGV